MTFSILVIGSFLLAPTLCCLHCCSKRALPPRATTGHSLRNLRTDSG